MPQQIELIATCPMGLEAIVAREIRDLGYNEVPSRMGVSVFWATSWPSAAPIFGLEPLIASW